MPRFRLAQTIHGWWEPEEWAMKTEVIGARMMPANSVPMPTSAYARALAVGNGAKRCTSRPTAPPAMAPMYRLGAKMPPALPEAYDTIVASLFLPESGRCQGI